MATACAATTARAGEPSGLPAFTFHETDGKVKDRGVSPLGTIAKSVDREDLKRKRRARFALLDMAATLLNGERVAACQRRPAGSAVSIHRAADGRASAQGLQQCGSVWHCPCCSPRISAGRRDELNRLLKWARSRGLVPLLMTLTGRHRRQDALARLLDGMKNAKRRLHQSRDWRAVADSISGHVTATEVPYGRHGWHLHYHVLLIVNAQDESTALSLFAGMRTAWERALRAEGLSCNDHGYDLQGASRAGDYIAKWGAAEELCLSGEKRARDPEKGRTVWQLLATAGGELDPEIGQDQAGALWTDYARLFKGRRQLTWSRGLKAAAGINDKSDEELLADAEQLELLSSGSTEIGRLTVVQWRAVLRAGLRCQLLEAVEADGAAGLSRVMSQLQLLEVHHDKHRRN